MVTNMKVERLFKQAGVSVLAGFVMSSAVMAEDINTLAGEAVEISTGFEGQETVEDFSPEIAVDPMPPELGEGAEGAGDFGEAVDEPEVYVDIEMVDQDPDCTGCGLVEGDAGEPMPVDDMMTTTGLDPVADFDAASNAPAETRGFSADRRDERGERGETGRQSGGLPKFLLR